MEKCLDGRPDKEPAVQQKTYTSGKLSQKWEFIPASGSTLKMSSSNSYTGTNGNRTKKVANGVTTEYYLNEGTIVAEKKGSDVIRYLFDENGGRYGFELNGAKYYYVFNGQGDVVAVANAIANEIARYTYDSWGRLLSVKDYQGNDKSGDPTFVGNINPIRYRGYYYDTETGFYATGTRYYDPVVGRFISPDTRDVLTATTDQPNHDKNLFAYCDNNPIMRADNSGEFWHIAIGAAIGGLIGGAVKAVSNVIEGKNITDGLGTAVLAGAASGALASTGVGLVGMAAGNAAISMAENATNQVIANKGFNNFDVGDMVTDGVIGGVSGVIGGAGKGTKHLTNLGKQTVKRTVNTTVNKGIKAGIKEGSKAVAYYGKSTAYYYKPYFKGLLKDTATSGLSAFASSDYMKYQYRYWVWRYL